MRQRDLAHDGQAQAAAGARGPRQPVEPLQHALALGHRDARAVVLDFEEGAHTARAGAHRDVPARLRVLDRVADQVDEQLAQQERVAAHPGRGNIEPEVHVLRERPVHPFIGALLHHLAQVDACEFRRPVAARLGARERQQLVGEARRADGRTVHVLQLGPAGVRHRLRHRQLGVGLQPGERRAQLVRGVGEEPLLVAVRLVHLVEELVERRDQGLGLGRRAALVDRPQVARRALQDLVRQPRQRREAARDAEPHQRESQHRKQGLGQHAAEQDVARQALPLDRGLRHLDRAGAVAAGHLQRGHADALAVVVGVIRCDAILGTRARRRLRDLAVAGDRAVGRVAHHEVDLVVLVGAHHRLGRARQVEHRAAVLQADALGQRDGRVDQRLVVGVGGRVDRQVIRGDRTHREDRRHRRDQQPQQVDAQAAGHQLSLKSSSM